MGPRLSTWSLSPVDRYSKMKTIAGGRRSWALPRWEIKRPHIPHSPSQGELPDYTHTERLLEGQKRRGAPPHSKWCQPTHRPLRWNPSWLRDAHAHMGGPWNKPNTDSEPGKARWLAKGNPEEMPHVRDSNYHEGATLSLSPPVCAYSHVLFFPLINTFLVSLLFCLFVEIYLSLALPLATGPWWSSG